MKVPEPADDCRSDAEPDEVKDLLRARDELVFEKETGKDAEQAGCNCGKCAEVTFGIVKCVPLFAGEILEVEVIGEVIAGFVFAADKIGCAEEELLCSGLGGAVSHG